MGRTLTVWLTVSQNTSVATRKVNCFPKKKKNSWIIVATVFLPSASCPWTWKSGQVSIFWKLFRVRDCEGHKSENRTLVNSFVEWCGRNNLLLNMAKTKEVVDFRRSKTPVSILGEDVEIESYKYLGVHLDNTLDWTRNTEALYKEGQSRLNFQGSSGLQLYATGCYVCSTSQMWWPPSFTQQYARAGELKLRRLDRSLRLIWTPHHKQCLSPSP